VRTVEALDRINRRVPFPVKGFIHSDNGSEFINSHFLYYCEHFDSLGARVYRTRRGCKEDNGFGERSHRTDDEEFYIPKVLGVYDSGGFLEVGRKWLWY